uniref:Glutathione S-transferase delta 4 n=1 Tax=Meteorus pulchricornis TaxID=51522 RepID=A0A4D6J7R5_9HYME|nr:glutathione S-transferase delta 4 [Meteorus pulchricornis]
MTIDLYYFPLSPPTRATMMVAKAVGVHLNLKVVDITKGEQFKPEFIRVNPQHTVPTMDDNGFILSESRTINGYLVNKYAKNDSLYPKDPKKKGIVDERLNFDLGTLYSRLFDCYIPVTFGLSSVIHQNDIEAIEEAFDKLNGFLEMGEFVAGDNLTIADFSVIISVSMAEIWGFDITRYNNVVIWYERCKQVLQKYEFDRINAPAKQLGEWFRANLETI